MLTQSKLSIRHPEYRYPVSKNPYYETIQKTQGRILQDNDTENRPGQWREILTQSMGKSPSELHVEIGCNGGHVLVEWARRNPDAGYIGIDYKFKQIYKGFERAVKKQTPNALFLRAHALRLGYVFAPGEIDHLYLLFSDPWPKKSQHGHRLVTTDWLRTVARCVRPGGSFEIRTDHAGYFEWMERELLGALDLWGVEVHSTDLYAGHADPTQLQIPEVTLFERIFIKSKIKIHRLHLRRLTA